MPRNIIPRHELCFWLHDQMTRLLVEASESGHVEMWHRSVRQALKRAGKEANNETTWEELANIGGVLSVPMKLDVLMAVVSDMLHFIHEALKAFEKRKFTVGYTLLRKPLTENLIILCKLAVDDDDFTKSFASGNLQKKQVTQMNPHEYMDLFEKAISKIPTKEFADGELLYRIIFEKGVDNGLQRRMQQSTHLITTRHPALTTPKFGLNAIFFHDQGDENYNVYDGLPLVLFFTTSLTLALFASYFPLSRTTENEILVRAIGLLSNLYEGRLDSLSRSLNKSLKEFFQCEWCESGNAKIRKRYASLFYLHDQIHCNSCNRLSHTPFSYLLRSGKMNIINSETNEKIHSLKRKFPTH